MKPPPFHLLTLLANGGGEGPARGRMDEFGDDVYGAQAGGDDEYGAPGGGDYYDEYGHEGEGFDDGATGAEREYPQGEGFNELDGATRPQAPRAVDSHFIEQREAEVVYDYPASPGGGALGQSGGVGVASTSSLPEEIDISTHGLIDETVQRLSGVHGVLGVLIVDADGRIVHATMPMEEAAKLASPTLQLLQRARSCAAATPDDELRMLCVRTRKYELLLCSEQQGAFAVCVLQDIAPTVGEAAAAAAPAEATPTARSVLSGAMGTVF